MQGTGRMSRYISLLRGINITGHSLIKMTALVELYSYLGFQNIETYLQSGNVLFDSSLADTKKIADTIEMEIKKKLGLNISVLIKTGSDLKKIIKNNPYLKKNSAVTEKFYVTLLFKKPKKELLDAINNITSGNDEYYINGDIIYLNCPYGYGRTKLNNNIFEKKLKVIATTRNWNTINKLLGLTELEKQ